MFLMLFLFDTTMVLPEELNMLVVNLNGVDLRVVEGDSSGKGIAIADAEGIERPYIEISGDTFNISFRCKRKKRAYFFGLIVSSGCFGSPGVSLILSGRWKSMFVNAEYSDVSVASGDGISNIIVTTSYGDFSLENSTFDRAVFKTGYGDIRVKNITAVNLDVSTDYGDIRMDHVVSGKISARSDYGDLIFTNIHSKEMDLETDYGDIRLKNVRVPCLKADTHYGEMEINK